jgi:hypothetical protein
LGPAPAENPRKAVALSAWCPRMVTVRTTPPAFIPPSGDQRRPMSEHRVADGPKFEFKLQCCPGPGDYGTRWLPPCCPSSARAEAVNLIVTEKSDGVPRRKPFIGDNDRVRRARSEVALSASPNHRLSEHDARQRITQNRTAREHSHERDDLCNVIEDWRSLRLITPSPP